MIPTGLQKLDEFLSGGIPDGVIVDIFGVNGTGKTQFAASLSWELGLGASVLRFDAKSYSKSKDLFYSIDTISWFKAAQLGKEISVLNFLTYNAFGNAILIANEYELIKDSVPEYFMHPGQSPGSINRHR